MDEADIRRRRTRQLIKEKFKGVDARFAAHIGKPPTTVARWFMTGKHARSITASAARHIEKTCALPKYWLEQEGNDQVPPPPPVEQERWARFSALAQGLTPEQLEEIVSEFDEKILAKMARYKQVNETAVRIFGTKKASTVSAARAAAKLPPAPRGEKKPPPSRKLPLDDPAARDDRTGDLFDGQ